MHSARRMRSLHCGVLSVPTHLERLAPLQQPSVHRPYWSWPHSPVHDIRSRNLPQNQRRNLPFPDRPGRRKAAGHRSGYGFRRPICMTSETKVSFGVHPCTVRQWGHWENVIRSGSLSISARSISTCVGISLSVFGHLNINCVKETSTSQPAKKGGAYAIQDKRNAAATVNALQFENRVAQTNVLFRFARQRLIHCLV